MLNKFQSIAVAGAAALAFTVATPATVAAHDIEVSMDSLDFGGDSKELLEKLIALDAGDIADLRSELADARSEVSDAISEIEDARAEVSAMPGGGILLKIAFSAASSAVTAATEEAFGELRVKLDGAESELSASADEVGPEEVAETQEAIDVIREGLDDIEAALDDLISAMKS